MSIKVFHETLGPELMARLEAHAARGLLDLDDLIDFKCVLIYFVVLGLNTKDAEVDAQTLELF
jgi:hypothetical protein